MSSERATHNYDGYNTRETKTHCTSKNILHANSGKATLDLRSMSYHLACSILCDDLKSYLVLIFWQVRYLFEFFAPYIQALLTNFSPGWLNLEHTEQRIFGVTRSVIRQFESIISVEGGAVWMPSSVKIVLPKTHTTSSQQNWRQTNSNYHFYTNFFRYNGRFSQYQKYF